MGRGDNKRRRPMVVSRRGRYRFQTGMVTASLLARGVPAAAAFSLSRELRDRVGGRLQITTDELEAERAAGEGALT